MKLALVYFCYDKDQELLKLSLNNMDHLRKYDDIDIYVMDDSSHPMTEIPDNVIYEKTYFNRGGNLNGSECLSGMINVYGKVLEREEYDWVIKIDPDVIVNSFEWLSHADINRHYHAGTIHHLFIRNNNSNYICHGALHCFSKIGVQELKRKFIENITDILDREKRNIRIAEDHFSCRLIGKDITKNFYIENKYNNPDINNDDLGMFFDFQCDAYDSQYIRHPLQDLRGYSSISFKSMDHESWKGNESDSDRTSGLSRQEEYVKLKFNINDISLYKGRISDNIFIPDNNYILTENMFVITCDENKLRQMFQWFDSVGLKHPEVFISNTGCDQAHYDIIQMIKERNLPYATIFEDDVYPHIDVLNKIKQIDPIIRQHIDNISNIILGYGYDGWHDSSRNDERVYKVFKRNTYTCQGDWAEFVTWKAYDERLNSLKNPSNLISYDYMKFENLQFNYADRFSQEFFSGDCLIVKDILFEHYDIIKNIKPVHQEFTGPDVYQINNEKHICVQNSSSKTFCGYSFARFGNQLYYLLHAFINGIKYDISSVNRDIIAVFNNYLKADDLIEQDIKQKPAVIHEYFQNFNINFTEDQLNCFIRKYILHDFFDDIQNIDQTVVAIHIRNGDYISKPQVKRLYMYDTKTYLTRAINYMKERGFKKYIIFTDNINQCIHLYDRFLKFMDIDFTYHLNGTFIQDFISLCSYRHKIITNSTYSVWSAYVSNVLFDNSFQDIIRPNFINRTKNPQKIYNPAWSIIRCD